MKRPLALSLAAVGAALSIGVAVATPGTGVVGTVLSRAVFDPISTSHSAGLDVAVQEITIAPGGHTGWHTHPGGVVILVESGTFTSTTTRAPPPTWPPDEASLSRVGRCSWHRTTARPIRLS